MWTPPDQVLGSIAFVRLFWRESTIVFLILICGAQWNCIGNHKIDARRHKLTEQTRQIKAEAAAEKLGIEMQAAHEQADLDRAEAKKRAADTVAEIDRATTAEEVLEALLRGTTHEPG